MDAYLSEIALDENLTVSKFISLAGLLPDHARLLADGLYRLAKSTSKLMISLLRQGSPKHQRIRAVPPLQDDRLPEALARGLQPRGAERALAHPNGRAGPLLRADPASKRHERKPRAALFGSANGQFSYRSGSGVASGAISPRDNYASVRMENRELKLEVARMRMRLTDLEKDHVSMKKELVRANPANRMLRSFAKKLRRLNSLFRISAFRPVNSKAPPDARLLLQKRRRHSIS
ncbi:hypothetical protein HPP92_013229 [Vanilla planifolia]|uniref:NPH3 domain-containing protein n=1 Tax=Vanilla planifolia TaxID=51239 RepID=A0A835UZT4_VANPL|nr:hypothetical protein HPP92_013229 [Vanilla planifolia]